MNGVERIWEIAEQISDRYGVNAQVIEVRFDREAIWSAQ